MKKTFRLILGTTILAMICCSFYGGSPIFSTSLSKYTYRITQQFEQISSERKNTLKEIGDFIIAKRKKHEKVSLLFVCTGNSRRSHFSQVWMHTAMVYYGIDSVYTYSGGTEPSEVNSRTVKALKEAGFRIKRNGSNHNAPYTIAMGKKSPSWTIFSKKYDHSQNPQNGFCAIMVCSDADRLCPVVPGADDRISLPYEDPKRFDNTPTEHMEYLMTCKLIAREMFFIGHYVKTVLK